jgi:phosphoglycerate dehydrogenase-like enzyme
MKVVAYLALPGGHWRIPDPDREAIERRLPGVRIADVDSDARLAEEIADAEIFFGFHIPEPVFARAQRLRWIHSASAGIEANLFPALVESRVTLSNSTGLHETCIPEHVLALLFAFARNLPAAFRLKQAHRWDRIEPLRRGGIREIAGSQLAVLGVGPIGRALVARAAGLGMRVRALRRHGERALPGAEQVVGPQGLHALLGWAHFVVLAVPLTAETRHLIGAEELRAMRRDAFLINIARGEVIDQEALVAALRAGTIAGAGLDVTTPEPLPPDDPLWELPNVILTPHISGYMPGYFPAVLALFAENLARFVAGEPLRNVVDKRLGYVAEARP